MLVSLREQMRACLPDYPLPADPDHTREDDVGRGVSDG
jgi:hypothetical protein